jgi:CHAT domain-containing protein/tetratricopeptide (TPR) repeat protein
MLGKLWRWFKRWLQRWRNPPQPKTRPQPAPPKPTRSDAETEALFLALLDQVQPDWSYGQIQGWLLAHALNPTELAAWLERFGQRLLASPEPNRPLAEQLVQFSQIDRSDLGRVAGAIGRELLERNASVDTVVNGPVLVDENIVSQAEASFNQGCQKYMAGNFVGAIALWDKALRLKPNYHEVWNNRGIVLSALGHNEEAISSYDKAIELKPDFHEAWLNRGNALSALGKHEAALSSYDKAIKLKPDSPKSWNNRGLVFLELRQHKAALSNFDKALEFKPDDHKIWLCRGNALSSLNRDEEAIDSYDKAIQVKPHFSPAWINRAAAICRLRQTKKLYPDLSDLLLLEQDTGSCFNAETPHIAALEAALPHGQSNPESWGRIHQVLGDAYFKHAEEQSDLRTYWREAIRKYEIALNYLIDDSLLEPRLETYQGMLRAALALRDRNLADRCCDEGSTILQALLDVANSYKKRQISLKFSRFNQLAVDLLVQSKKIDSALIAAECNKNRCLTRLLDQWPEQIISPSYTEIRQLLRPQTAILYWHLSDDALTTFLLLPDQAQPEILEADTSSLRQRQRQFSQWQTDWNRDYGDYRAKKDEETNSASARASHIWRRQLPQRLSQLREILGTAAIEQQLIGITHLILVPHRDLHRFPLHALFRQPCTYLPSLQIGLNLQTRPAPDLQTASLLSVADPQSDRAEMVYAQIESAVIQQWFSQVTALSPQQASKTNVTRALQQSCQLFHFTGHGSHDDLNPQNSAIGLADGEILTAREISRLPLQSCYLASIAACETALTSRQSIDTEYVGLVSALMQAGTAHVLSTLWNVEEISSTWLMVRFYQQLLNGHSPAQALQQAQQWLSAITPPELAAWLKSLTDLDLPSSIREYLRQEAERIRESTTIISEQLGPGQTSSEQPLYAHPYYWAAYTLTGPFPGTVPL